MLYSIHKVGRSVLAIEKTPQWRWKSAKIEVLFDSNPSDVLQLGPNG